MKYILSTFVALFIAFAIWAYFGNEDSRSQITDGFEIPDGNYSASLQNDVTGKTDSFSDCDVNVKIKNGGVVEVDSSNNNALIWKNASQPAIISNKSTGECWPEFCGAFARIKTSLGSSYKVYVYDHCKAERCGSNFTSRKLLPEKINLSGSN